MKLVSSNRIKRNFIVKVILITIGYIILLTIIPFKVVSVITGYVSDMCVHLLDRMSIYLE